MIFGSRENLRALPPERRRMDGIIETFKTSAKSCLRYLKKQRLRDVHDGVT